MHAQARGAILEIVSFLFQEEPEGKIYPKNISNNVQTDKRIQLIKI